VSTDATILPSLAAYQESDFGMQLRTRSGDAGELERELRALIAAGLIVRFRAVSEVSAGTEKTQALAELLDCPALAAAAAGAASE
jgi:hypothetical protein